MRVFAPLQLKFNKFFSSTKNVLVLLTGLIIVTFLSTLIVFLYHPLHDKPQSAIVPIVGVKNVSNPGSTNAAKPLDVLEWQKQINVSPSNVDAETTAVERVSDTQTYVAGSLQIPPGWRAQWAITSIAPTENQWLDEEPAPELVTYVRLITDTVTTTKPTAQSVLTKPVDQEQVPMPQGMNNPKTAYATKYNDKVFSILQAVDVNDGLNNGVSDANGDVSEMTISCLDLKTFQACNEGGVTFPSYMSSSAGTKLGAAGSPKDISTPYTFKAGLYDDGGKLYIPVQRGDDYGVNCTDLNTLENCGFKTYGASPAPTQGVGRNPTLISGFVQEGNKLYGHTNPDNNNSNPLDDFVEVFCFDMATPNNECSGFESAVTTPVPSLYRPEHSDAFYTPGQHVVIGDNYYFLMNYDEANTKLNSAASNYYTQTVFANRLVCFNVVSKSMCDGWPTANPIYKAPVWECIPGCGFRDKRQTVHGASVTESAAAAVGDSPIDTKPYERPRQLFIARNTDLSIKGLCVPIGHMSGADPGTKCFNHTNGQVDVAIKPASFTPNQWLNVPWWPNYEVKEMDGRLYSSWYLPANNALGYGKKSAVICYDWSAQKNCDGYRAPHYWYEVNQADTQEVAYLPDGDCMIGVSRNNFVWSFDKQTGETPCRQVDNMVDIKPAQSLSGAYCDGGEQRTTQWGHLQLNRTSLYDYKKLNITIKDKNDNTVTSLNNVDIKDINSQRIDLSSINFSGDTSELKVEIDSELNNTAPWGINPATDKMNYPLVTVVMEAEPVQYCYQTTVNKICDTSSAVSTSDIKSITENDVLTKSSISALTVHQLPEVQCFKDLKVEVVADKTQVREGENITYTIRATNLANIDDSGRGNIPAEVVIEGTIPSNMSFVSASAGNSVDSNKVRWTNQAVNASNTKEKSITLRPKASSAQSEGDPFKAYAATTTTPVVFQAQAIYSGDVQQANNSATNSSVVIVSEVAPPPTDPDPEPEPEPTNDGTADDQPPQAGQTTPALPTNNNQPPPAVSPSSERNLTPRAIRSIIPPSLGNTVENFFQTIDSAVAPIPPGVAAAIPYGTIAFLIAFAIIYIYQSIQESKSRRKLKDAFKRFKRTEELRKNYLDLTSHYLNTPIATMGSTLDLLASLKELPETTASAARQRLKRLTDNVQNLLSQSQGVAKQAQTAAAVINPIVKNKKLFARGVILPIVGVLVVSVLANVVFVWADKYDASTMTLAVQSSYYILSAIALIITFNVYQGQKYATAVVEQELHLEKQLAASQSQFIASSSQTLTQDIIELDQLSPAIIVVPKGNIFASGLSALKNAIAKLAYLNVLTSNNTNPSIPNQTIKSLVKEVIAKLQPYADNANIAIKLAVEPGLTVKIDVDGFKQILASLINNAIKFNHPGGNVDVAVSRHDKDNIRVVVSDSGRGIPKDKIGNLFAPFGRATDSLEYNFEGFGLDLYMDKLIAEQNGGSIAISSEEGTGTTVTVVLPS